MRLITKVCNYSNAIPQGYVVGDIETCETRLMSDDEIIKYLLSGHTLDNAEYDKEKGCLVGTEGSLDDLPTRIYDYKKDIEYLNIDILAILQKGEYNSTVIYKVLNYLGETSYMTEANLIKAIIKRNINFCNARITFSSKGQARISPIKGKFKDLDMKFLTQGEVINCQGTSN